MNIIYCRLHHSAADIDPATRWRLSVLRSIMEWIRCWVRQSERKLLAGERAHPPADEGRRVQAEVSRTAEGLAFVVLGRVQHVHCGSVHHVQCGLYTTFLWPCTSRSLWLTSPTATSSRSAGFRATWTTMRLVLTTGAASAHTTETSVAMRRRITEGSGSWVEQACTLRSMLEVCRSNGTCCSVVQAWCTPKCYWNVHSWSLHALTLNVILSFTLLRECARRTTVTSRRYWTHKSIVFMTHTYLYALIFICSVGL